MNLRSLLLVCASAGVLMAADPRLLEIRMVYLLPMAGGLDQYLANRLTLNGRYTVVTDPSKADALLTDQIGQGFEDKYTDLYPPPPPPAAPPETAKDKKPADEKSMVSMMASGSGGSRASSFSKSKGNIFLVDRGSRQVIWSTFLRPRNASPAELNHTADQIVDRMDDAADNYLKASNKRARNIAAPPPATAPNAPPAPAPPK